MYACQDSGEAGALSKEAHEKALKLCREWDTDGDGAISHSELSKALEVTFPDCSEEDVTLLVKTVDLNGDGYIQFSEFFQWLALPRRARRSFQEQFSLFVTEEIHRGPDGRRDDTSPRTHDAHLLTDFTHPLLARLQVVTSPPDVPAKTVVVEESFSPVGRSPAGHRGGRGGGGPRARLRRRSDGVRFAITAAPAVASTYFGAGREGTAEDHLLAKLEGLAQAYRAVLQEFCASGPPEGPPADAGLRLVVLPLRDDRGRSSSITPDIYFSALALALVRLNKGEQDRLDRVSPLELYIGQEAAASSYRANLADKARVANTVPRPAGGGKVEYKRRSFDWVRKDNDAESRLQRLQAFFLTQRAVWHRAYGLGSAGSQVKLNLVDRMIQGTRMLEAAVDAGLRRAETGAASQTRLPSADRTRGSLQVLTVNELGNPSLNDGATVMEIAQELSSQGMRVAAVSAASAYQVGGGVSVGGRHALEEAWCMTSTLFSSLATLSHAEKASSDMASRQLRQHLPVTGCVASPDVEIFRASTSRGYELLAKPVAICAVLSVAMFNRNPAISDSPLDSPSDPSVYLEQTRSKLEAVLSAAAEVDAEVLVIPDVGCGVFKNAPCLIGGCLGVELARCNAPGLRQVVLASQNRAFVDACRRAAKGQDPRTPCGEGAGCAKFDDPAHTARCLHPNDVAGSCSVESILLNIAEHPEEAPRPQCRYGRLCHIRNREHLARFAHPEDHDLAPPGFASPDSSPAAAKLGPGSGERLGGARPPPDASPSPGQSSPAGVGPASGAGAGAAVVDSRRVCRYGDKCYSKDPKHLADFAHPWKDGTESAQDRKKRLDTKLAHELLSEAKEGRWSAVKDCLMSNPDVVNLRPDARAFALVHHAAHQVNMDVLFWLVDQYGVDVKTVTKDGKTVMQVLEHAMKEAPPESPEGERNDDRIRRWVAARAAGERPPKPTLEKVPSKSSGTSAGASTASPSSASQWPSDVIQVRGTEKVEGYYLEMATPFAGCPAFQRHRTTLEDLAAKRLGEPMQQFLFYHSIFGWSIAQALGDDALLAYLGASRCGRDPCATTLADCWKVWQPTRLFGGGIFTDDRSMKCSRPFSISGFRMK